MNQIANPSGRTTALRYLSRLKAELDVEAFQQAREQRIQKHLNGERTRRANKRLLNQMLGVIEVDSSVTKL